MNKVIPVSVRDKIATKTGDDVYVCGNSDFVIEFDFDGEWDEFDTKTARFEWNDGHYDKVFSGNTCPVPIISDTHRFHVGVFAGNLRTTTAAYVPAKKSILCRGGSPHNPPPDVYAQIMEKLNSMSGGDVSPEAIEAAVNKYLEEHPIESGGIDVEQLEQAVQDALKEAKESGEFNGTDGKDGKDADVTTENITKALGYTPAKQEDVNSLNEEIAQYKTVTPQMFGAVADGVADDTAAVQTALDTGNIIYFPPGRYKVTNQLTVTRSCKITMCKPYPITSGADYPLTSADNWMGSRIETYTSDEYGMLIGDGVQIDGLYMRAMQGFSGVLFKYDGHLGCATYPSQVRLSHIRLDCAYYTINPVSMFDFVPNGSYFAVLDDICIGSLRGNQICGYGFRTVLDGEGGWGNSMRINNLCIDIRADYPLYLDGNGGGMENWVFENLAIQAYAYRPDEPGYLGREGHVNVITLKRVQHPVFLGCVIWDLHAANVIGDVIYVDEYTTGISCFGCNEPFDDIEMVLKGKLKNASDTLNIKNLTMGVTVVEESGANRLTLSDGFHESSVDIPAATASDEQIANGVSKWFDENAQPEEQVGRNKFNPLDLDTINASIGNDGKPYYDSNMTSTHYIKASTGDVVGVSKAGVDVACSAIVCFDAEKVVVGTMGNFASASPKTITVANTAYIRVVFSSGTVAYKDRVTAQIMITVNDPLTTTGTDRVYEPYKTTYVGGLGDLFVLQSPNGTQYKLSVTDDGVLIATATKGEEDDVIKDVLWSLSDKTPVMAGYKMSDNSRTINIGTYILGTSVLGFWNDAVAPTVTLNNEDFALTTVQNGIGFGVPYKLTPGSTYQISFTTDAYARASIVYYDDTGVFYEHEPIMEEYETPGTFTHRFVVKPQAYLVFTFASPTAGASVNFSNVVLSYVE